VKIFPRRFRRGLIEATPRWLACLRSMPFPRRFRRGLIEAYREFDRARANLRFPRRFRRGLIEALPASSTFTPRVNISAAIPPRPH